MYTLRITDDNAVIGKRSTIMEKSNCVDDILIITNKLYKGQIDMSDTDMRMEYVLPISHKIKNTLLTISEIKEDEGLIYYKIPVTARIAAEPGDIEVSFTFSKVIRDDESNTIESYVRKTQSGIIHITPIAPYENYDTSEYLTELDQRIIEMQKLQKDIKDLHQAAYDNMPTDIKLNANDNKLTLTNSDGDTGNGVKISDLSDAIAKELTGTDPDGAQDGVVHVDKVPEAQVFDLDELLK